MKQYEDVFLELLKAGMWGRKPQVPQGFAEWGSVVRLAKSQSVLGVVGQAMLSDEEIASNMPQEFRTKVKKFVMNNMLTHNLLNNTLIKVVSTLREGGVESVLLKGQGLARNYPQPELRQCGDIDLYVGLNNGEKAYELLSPIAVHADDKAYVTVGKHYHVTMPGGVEVEVHRYTDNHLTKKLEETYQAASDKGTSEGLVTYDFAGTPVNTPSDDFNAFFIFNHLFHHFLTSGIGLRQFCDWMMFLHTRKGKLDTDYLHKLLTDMELLGPWQAFGCVLADWLGMPEDEFPFFDRKQAGRVDKIVRRVLNEGNFGRERAIVKNRGTNYLLNKTRSFFGHTAKSIGLISIFPKPVWYQFKNTIVHGFAAVWADFRIKLSIESPLSEREDLGER